MRARQWLETGLAAITFVIACTVIMSHLALVPGGHWGSDEYYNLVRFDQTGMTWLLVRMLQWSPRPASDMLLYLYSLAVARWRAPLIGPFLLATWAILILSAIAAAWQSDRAGRLSRLSVAASVLAMFLLGHRINYLFYWPMGAAPYLLDLTGITVVVFQVVFGGTTRRLGRLACALGLCVAAISSETGLFFSLSFTAALLFLESGGPVWQRPSPLVPSVIAFLIAMCLIYVVAANPWEGIGQASEYFHNVAANRITKSSEAALIAGLVFAVTSRLLPLRRPSGWYLIPLGVSLATGACLAYIVQTNPSRGIDQSSRYFHNIPSSLIATLLGISPDFFLGDGSPAGLTSFEWFVTMGLLLLGFAWALRSSLTRPASPREMAALFTGLAGCFILTTFTSYYEYGTQLHEPQPEFRKCLIVLALLAVASLVASRLSWRSLHIAGPAALICALGIGAVERLPALIGDYRLIPSIREARAATWRNGLDPATDTLRYVASPRGHIVYSMIPSPPGHFVLRGPGVDPWMDGLMEYFDKRELEFVPLSEQPHAPRP